MSEKKYTGYGYHGGGRKPTGRKSVTVSFSALPEEAAAIRARARALGMSVSRYLVSLAVEEIRKQEGQ